MQNKQPSEVQFQVTDPVKVYDPDPRSQFFIIGRIVYIDTNKNTNRYGVLYYERRSKNLQVMKAAEYQMGKMPVENPPGCPSNSTAHAHIEDMIAKENDAT